MRGSQTRQASLLCLVDSQKLIPHEHPLRAIKVLADDALLLIALYSIRSETQFCEQLRYNLLFRWFLDMDMVAEPFDHCAFSDNRDRLIQHEATAKFFRKSSRARGKPDG